MIGCGFLHPLLSSIGMKMLSARHSLFSSIRNLIYVGLEIVHDGARAKSIDSFIGGKNLGLVIINRLDQLCIYIYINRKVKIQTS
jgi:hypothetical protein